MFDMFADKNELKMCQKVTSFDLRTALKRRQDRNHYVLSRVFRTNFKFPIYIQQAQYNGMLFLIFRCNTVETAYNEVEGCVKIICYTQPSLQPISLYHKQMNRKFRHTFLHLFATNVKYTSFISWYPFLRIEIFIFNC